MGACSSSASKDRPNQRHSIDEGTFDSPPSSPFERFNNLSSARKINDIIKEYSSTDLDAEFVQVFDAGRAFADDERVIACEPPDHCCCTAAPLSE